MARCSKLRNTPAGGPVGGQRLQARGRHAPSTLGNSERRGFWTVHLPGGRSWREGSSRVTRQRPPESETRTPEVAPHPRAAGGEAGRRRGPPPLTPPCALPYASQTETATPGTPKSGLLTQERKEGARDHPEEKHKRGRLRVERDPCAGKRRSPFDAATRVESQ